MKSLVRLAVVGGLLVGVVAVSPVEARSSNSKDRVGICHRQRARPDQPSVFTLKQLQPRAAAIHLRRHDDGVPLGVVPDRLGYKFDQQCRQVPFDIVNVAGPGNDPQEEGAISAALAALSERTGIPITFTGVPSVSDVIEEALGSGSPIVVPDPDTGDPVDAEVVFLPEPTSIPALADAGLIVPASPEARSTVDDGWPSGWAEIGSVDGTRYAVPTKADLKSLVWYRPDSFAAAGYAVPTTYDQLVALTATMIANGDTPWCVGNATGIATGFVFTDWVEDRLLGSEPVEVYDAWVANEVGFDDPRIRAAWSDVIDLWTTPGAVFEGLATPTAPGVGISETHFFDSFFTFAFAEGACMMHKQASFVSFAFDPDDPGVSVFQFPADAAAPGNAVLGSTNVAVATSDSIEVSLVHAYLASAEHADARYVAQGGGYISAVAGQDLSLRSELDVTITEMLTGADEFRFDASDLMPPEIRAETLADGGFWREGTNAVIGVGNISRFPVAGDDPSTPEIEDYYYASAVVPEGEGNVLTIVVEGDDPRTPEVEEFFLNTYEGSSVDDATTAVADRFCEVLPSGAAC